MWTLENIRMNTVAVVDVVVKAFFFKLNNKNDRDAARSILA